MEAEKKELRLYNTMTQQKEVFKPINPGKVGMYVCGITAYGFSHIGHACASVSFDVLYRHLGIPTNICMKGWVKVGMLDQAKDFVDKRKSEFGAKMADDLNTVHILQGAYQRALEFINASIGELKKMLSYAERMSLFVSLFEIEKAAREVLDVLGLLNDLSCAEILKEMKQKALTRAGLSEEDFSQKMEERTMARKNKDF
ncbi:hypothetical protein YC2023_065477 [Brassica napus]